MSKPTHSVDNDRSVNRNKNKKKSTNEQQQQQINKVQCTSTGQQREGELRKVKSLCNLLLAAKKKTRQNRQYAYMYIFHWKKLTHKLNKRAARQIAPMFANWACGDFLPRQRHSQRAVTLEWGTAGWVGGEWGWQQTTGDNKFWLPSTINK